MQSLEYLPGIKEVVSDMALAPAFWRGLQVGDAVVERIDELETIGTLKFHSVITENQLRLEHKLKERLSHTVKPRK